MKARTQKQEVRLGPALEARLQSVWDRLSDKEQVVATFLRRDPKGFVSHSISALAASCGVSETVVIRLYRKLGYSGFHQFKIDIAQSLTEVGPEQPGALRFGDDIETIKRKVFAVTREALEESVDAVETEQLRRAVDALLGARRVVVAAFGGSAPVGLDLTHKLLKQGIVATFYSDSHMQVMAATVFGPGDVLVAVSHSGNSRDIVEALEMARERGATTLLITGFPLSPAAKVADIVLVAVAREREYQADSITSRIVQLAVIDTLYIAMIFAQKEAGLAAVRATSVAAARKKL